MKKLIALMLVLVMLAVVMTACGKKTADTAKEAATTVEEKSEEAAETVEEAAGAVEGTVEETVEEVQDLLAYLDEHVPDTQPDTVFADKLADCVLIEAQLPDRGPHYASTLSRFDFYTTEAQVDRFIDLTVQASNHRPLWSNRGWTVGEMRHLIDTGE